MRIGFGYDVHCLVEGRPLILGGISIPHSHGLLGHSDADVLTHAIMDALLGAAALGDIGMHFSDRDPQFKDISSILLLERVKEILAQEGYSCHNLDCTLVAQEPKLAPYREQIRAKLAEAIKVGVEQISVKATTTEGLGFTGQKEGIAAYAVCTIRKVASNE